MRNLFFILSAFTTQEGVSLKINFYQQLEDFNQDKRIKLAVETFNTHE